MKFATTLAVLALSSFGILACTADTPSVEETDVDDAQEIEGIAVETDGIQTQTVYNGPNAWICKHRRLCKPGGNCITETRYKTRAKCEAACEIPCVAAGVPTKR